jgi:hypothetical protein
MPVKNDRFLMARENLGKPFITGRFFMGPLLKFKRCAPCLP